MYQTRIGLNMPEMDVACPICPILFPLSLLIPQKEFSKNHSQTFWKPNPI
jgi:hypothetical protein